MHYYYISGTSRGIGQALALQLLDEPENYVIGISRSQSIRHERYEHISMDLSQTRELASFPFIPLPDAQGIYLINNAGALGPARHVGQQQVEDLQALFQLNLLAPSLLMEGFVRAYQQVPVRKVVLNVSSGAGRHPIEAWSAYCASKAALDSYTEVAALEQRRMAAHPIQFFSVAPGIVDTDMQAQIRRLPPEQFSEVDRFVAYKQNGTLSSPQKAAELLLRVCRSPEQYSEVKLDVRHF